MVDPASCQGCGSCAVECPNSATVISGFEDGAIMDRKLTAQEISLGAEPSGAKKTMRAIVFSKRQMEDI